MNRVVRQFRSLGKSGRCGLVAYFTCGDPGVQESVEIALALERAGADVLELGVPFSDPIADGPVIQAAAQRALERGTTMADVLRIARAIRERSEIPLVAFSYLNPVLRYGASRFAADARMAGFDSVLLTDLPPEAAAEIRGPIRDAGLGTVFLLAPTSTAERIRLADRASDGFVYYVSTTGVTGARRELDPRLLDRLGEIRPKVKNPLAVGFGISKREHWEALAGRCDAVVVGSAIVRAAADGEPAGAAGRAASVVREILGTNGSDLGGRR
ncbi:MAG TPA: tryptophan synthase subunit alpha [Thermoanaerobaculia bacterium]|nr:tryptophan synthase subunit alpha [Thermoanaerobaculia bacterium]